jgi:membrane protein
LHYAAEYPRKLRQPLAFDTIIIPTLVPLEPTSTLPQPAQTVPNLGSRPQIRKQPSLTLSTAKYLLRTDVHTFAFSVAANSILSFFPFVVLVMTLVRRVFHSRVMYDVVVELLRDYLPAGQDFVIRNLTAMSNAKHRVQAVSLIILLVTSSGVFMPLEVALNRIWRFPNNRSYFGNQLISLGLAFSCGVLALLSIALTAGNVALMTFLLRGHGTGFIRVVGFVVMKVFAIAASVAIFFLIYWLLPNGKVPARAVLPTAIVMGLLSEALKYGYILALPWLNFGEVYGPFALSVTLMFWAFLTGLLLLAGANLSAEDHLRQKI